MMNSFISDASEVVVGEEQYPDLLTYYQKTKIMVNNTFESLLVAALFSNSIAGMNVGTICYIIISLVLMRLIDRNQPYLESKKKILKVNLAISGILLVLRLILGMTNVTNHESQKQRVLWLGSFGFRYFVEGKLDFLTTL